MKISHPAGQVLCGTVHLEGFGLHTGSAAILDIEPAAQGRGRVFIRDDLPGRPEIKAGIAQVHHRQQCTGLRQGKAEVLTVEHLLAALAGLGIWDANIRLSGPELPILDGSAASFVEALLGAGLRPGPTSVSFFKLMHPVQVQQDDSWICLEPASSLALDGHLEFEHIMLQDQRFSFVFGQDDFVRELAPARTFGFLKDEERLRKAGLAKGASLENAVVIDDFSILNPGGLRFANEFARHKVLDLLGDLSLLGKPLLAKVKSHKAGHGLHHDLVRKLSSESQEHKIVQMDQMSNDPLLMVCPPEPHRA